MSLKDFIESKNFKKVIWGVGIFLAVLVIFQAGVFVGYKEASFSYRLGDNFHNTFGDGPRGPMGFSQGIPPGGFSDAHGVAGKIIKINLPNIFVEGGDAVEKTVLVSDDTIIREFREDISKDNLKVGEDVVVIGAPDDSGQIVAKLIRIMPVFGTTTPIK